MKWFRIFKKNINNQKNREINQPSKLKKMTNLKNNRFKNYKISNNNISSNMKPNLQDSKNLLKKYNNKIQI